MNKIKDYYTNMTEYLILDQYNIKIILKENLYHVG